MYIFIEILEQVYEKNIVSTTNKNDTIYIYM